MIMEMTVCTVSALLRCRRRVSLFMTSVCRNVNNNHFQCQKRTDKCIICLMTTSQKRTRDEWSLVNLMNNNCFLNINFVS